jgi:hypothetical protein
VSADVRAAAAGLGLSAAALAALARDVTLVARGPLPIPSGWSLQAGQLAVAPATPASLAVLAVRRDGLPVPVAPSGMLAAVVVAAGVEIAERDGRTLVADHDGLQLVAPAGTLGLRSIGASGAVFQRDLTTVERAVNAVAAHYVRTARPLPVWPDARASATSVSVAPDPVQLVVVDAFERVVHAGWLDDKTSGSATSVGAVVDQVARRFGFASGAVPIAFGRDLLLGGRPVLVALTRSRRPLSAGDGDALQVEAVTGEHPRLARAALHAVGAALRAPSRLLH